MSQYQGNMPGNMPPGQFPPEPFQPYGSGNYGQPPRRTSGSAITSLVLGILGCVPLVTSVAAIIFGIVGISSTRKPGVGGRGMAIAGIVLGAIGILCWSGVVTGVSMAYVKTAPDRVVATSFINNLAAANLTAAQSQAAPSFAPVKLQALATQVQTYGTLQAFQIIISFPISNPDGTSTTTVSGAATFNGNSKRVIVQIVHPLTGGAQVQDCQIR